MEPFQLSRTLFIRQVTRIASDLNLIKWHVQEKEWMSGIISNYQRMIAIAGYDIAAAIANELDDTDRENS